MQKSFLGYDSPKEYGCARWISGKRGTHPIVHARSPVASPRLIRNSPAIQPISASPHLSAPHRAPTHSSQSHPGCQSGEYYGACTRRRQGKSRSRRTDRGRSTRFTFSPNTSSLRTGGSFASDRAASFRNHGLIVEPRRQRYKKEPGKRRITPNTQRGPFDFTQGRLFGRDQDHFTRRRGGAEKNPTKTYSELCVSA